MHCQTYFSAGLAKLQKWLAALVLAKLVFLKGKMKAHFYKKQVINKIKVLV